MAQWLEDIELGHRIDLGAWTFREEEMIAFAKKFDPQPFHIDPIAAKKSFYGGLIASGWYVNAIWMKLMMRHRQAQAERYDKPPEGEGDGKARPQGGPSPGFLELEWRRPVYAGDTLHFRTTTHEKLLMKSRPEWGIIRSLNEAVDGDGTVVMRCLGQAMVMRKPREE